MRTGCTALTYITASKVSTIIHLQKYPGGEEFYAEPSPRSRSRSWSWHFKDEDGPSNGYNAQENEPSEVSSEHYQQRGEGRSHHLGIPAVSNDKPPLRLTQQVRGDFWIIPAAWKDSTTPELQYSTDIHVSRYPTHWGLPSLQEACTQERSGSLTTAAQLVEC